MGKFVRAITATGGVVCYALDSTDIVAQAEQLHKTSAVVTAALGRLLTAASIMSATLKGDKNSLTLRLAGGGATGNVVAVADSIGNVKGYVGNAIVELPLNQYGKLDVSGAVGKEGTLHVIKDLGLKEPYIGMAPIVSGEIAEDITNYFATSEQLPTVCALGVLVNPDLTVKAAGGFIAQLLPGAQDSDIDMLEENINSLPSVSAMIESGLTPEDITLKVLANMEPDLLDSHNVEYRCDCSRERTAGVLSSIDKAELEAILVEDGEAELHCHFCNTNYCFGAEEITEMIANKD